jgi:ABC-2 type transport system ATP-binding protein
MSAYDLVRHLAEIHGLPRKEAINRASDVLWQVGLGEERLRPVGTFSTGQRQRVKLAAAIAHDPLLVLLDEPTDGLDPTQRDAMLALIRRIGSEFGIDIVLSSHLLEEVERICDHAVILAGGEVAAAGGLDELRGVGSGAVVELDDGMDAMEARLGASPHLEVRRQGGRLDVTSVELSEDALFDAIRDALADTQCALRRLLPRRASLEDVYLRFGSTPDAPTEARL